MKSVASTGIEFMDEGTADLAELRDDIDHIDDRIADLIAARIETAADVAAVKADSDVALVDEDREADVTAQYAERFDSAGLNPDHGRELAEFLIDVALAEERAIADQA